MTFGSNKTPGDTIHGTVKNVNRSPMGGKRLEVEATFQKKLEFEKPTIYDAVQNKGGGGGSLRKDSRTIRVDMTDEEAKNFKKNDHIDAVVQEKYAQKGQSSRFGLGSEDDIYIYVEPSGGGNRGGGGSRWNRFKGA